VIRLLIVASSAVARAGLEALAASSPELLVVGSLSDFAGGEDLKADVVLSAVAAGDLPFAGVTAPMVVLTSEAEPAWTLELLRQGVRAVLARDASQAEILAAVEAAASGMSVIDPRDLEVLLSSAMPVLSAEDASALTGRELEVLRLLAEGDSNKIIAWKLGISESTVKFHIASILAKLGASTRTEAVTIGIRRGLVLL